MKKSLMLFSLLGCVAATAGTVAIVSDDFNIKLAGKAVTEQTTRRIWYINNTAQNGNEYFRWDSLRLMDITNEKFYDGQVVVGEIRRGLYFVDVPINCKKVLFQGTENGRGFGWGDAGWQTEDLTLPDWNSSSSDIYWINGLYSNEKRTPSTGSVSLTDGQMGWLLSWYDSCDASYAYGYNAWKQLNKNFYAPNSSSLNPEYAVTKANKEPNEGVTIGQKIAQLSSMSEI